MYKAMLISFDYRNAGIISSRQCYECQSYYLDFLDQEEAEAYLMKDVRKMLSAFCKYTDVRFSVEAMTENYKYVKNFCIEQTMSDSINDVFTMYVYDANGKRTERKAGKKAVSAMVLENFRQLVRVNENEKLISA